MARDADNKGRGRQQGVQAQEGKWEGGQVEGMQGRVGGKGYKHHNGKCGVRRHWGGRPGDNKKSQAT